MYGLYLPVYAQTETRGECQASYSIILLFPLKQDFSLNPVLVILVRSAGQHTSRIRLSLPQAPLDVSNFYVGAGDQIQALMLVRQTVYELCHLPSLSWLFENRKTCWFLRVIGISLNIPNGCFPVSKANFVPWCGFVSWGGRVCFESGSFDIS